jgi:hypothetical protein
MPQPPRFFCGVPAWPRVGADRIVSLEQFTPAEVHAACREPINRDHWRIKIRNHRRRPRHSIRRLHNRMIAGNQRPAKEPAALALGDDVAHPGKGSGSR